MYNTCISVLTSRRSVIERLKILNSEVSLNDEAICWQRKKQQPGHYYRCSDTELAHDQSNVHYTLYSLTLVVPQHFNTRSSVIIQHTCMMSNKLKHTKMVAIIHLKNILKNNKYKLGTFLRNQPFNQHAAIACGYSMRTTQSQKCWFAATIQKQMEINYRLSTTYYPSK